MGLALRLLPIDARQRLFGLAHTVLSLGDLSCDLGARIRGQARLLPDGHAITGYFGKRIESGYHQDELCYGKLVNDAYGAPYRWLTAEELLSVLEEHWPGSPITAYVRALPRDGLIVLDWH